MEDPKEIAAQLLADLSAQRAYRLNENMGIPQPPITWCGMCGESVEFDGSCNCPSGYSKDDIERRRAS